MCGGTVWVHILIKIKSKVMCMLWKIFSIVSMLEGGIGDEDLLYVFLILFFNYSNGIIMHFYC